MLLVIWHLFFYAINLLSLGIFSFATVASIIAVTECYQESDFLDESLCVLAVLSAIADAMSIYVFLDLLGYLPC